MLARSVDDNENDDSEMLLPGLLCHTTRRAHKALKILYVDYGLSIHPESVGINSKLILSPEVRPIPWGGGRYLEIRPVTLSASFGSDSPGTETLRCAQGDRQDTSQARSREVFSPNV